MKHLNRGPIITRTVEHGVCHKTDSTSPMRGYALGVREGDGALTLLVLRSYNDGVSPEVWVTSMLTGTPYQYPWTVTP